MNLPCFNSFSAALEQQLTHSARIDILTEVTIGIAGCAETTNYYPFRLLEFELALQP